jgi:hypothetical protein
VIVSFGPEVRVPAPVRSFVAAPHSRHAIVESDGEQHGVELRRASRQRLLRRLSSL